MVTGHAGNENAARLKRAQKEELEEILSRPPSEAGVKAGFWDVPALKDVVSIKFGVEYRSESSYRLLMRFPGGRRCYGVGCCVSCWRVWWGWVAQ